MDEEQYIYNDEQTFDLNNMFLETPALPADKRLVLEEVSVRIIMNSVLAERGIGTYAVITTIANGQEVRMISHSRIYHQNGCIMKEKDYIFVPS